MPAQSRASLLEKYGQRVFELSDPLDSKEQCLTDRIMNMSLHLTIVKALLMC